ncbi:MAG: phage major capsid protein [Bacilli bacterium]
MNVLELRRKAQEKLAEAKKIREAAAGTKEGLSDQDLDQINGLVAEHDRLLSQADQMEKLDARLDAAPQSGGRPNFEQKVEVGRPRFEDDPARGFKSHEDFLLGVMAFSRGQDPGPGNSEKLKSLAKDLGEGAGFMLPSAFSPRRFAAGSDEHGVYTAPHGGLFVPNQVIGGVQETMWAGDPTAGLTRRIPMTTPTVELAARVDKNHTTSVTGGFRVYRTSETQETAASRAEYEKVILRASKLMGVAYATAELLNYSVVSFIAIIEAGFRTEFASKVLDEKMRGTGAGEYSGILSTATNPSLIVVPKEDNQVAGTIVYANLVKMLSRIWKKSGTPVWMINPDCVEQLAQLTDPAGRLIWQPSARDGEPDRLLGRPIVEAEECSALGDQGDISLCNWSEYLEGTLRPVEGASSIHVRFLNDETAFRFTLSNAGAPWWRSALTPKNGQTKSPFVTLAERA